MISKILNILRTPYPTYLCTAVMIALCLIPSQPFVQVGITETIPIILHFTEFFVLGALTLLFYKNPKKALAYCLFIAILTEFIQSFTPDRIPDLFDISINLVGSFAGIASASIIDF